MALNDRDLMSSSDASAEFKRYLRMFGRHKGLIALCLVLALCTMLIVLEYLPQVYESNVVLLIRDSRLVARDVQQLMGGILESPGGANVDRQQVSTLAGRIRSRPFLERVIRTLRINEEPGIRAQAEEQRHKHPNVTADELAVRILVDYMQSRIRVTTQGPGMYRVSVADRKAATAQNLAWHISALFVDLSDQERTENIKDARTLGLDLVRTYTEELRRSEEALEQFKQGRIEQGFTQRIVRIDNLSVAVALRQRILDGASDARIRARTLQDSLSRQGIAVALEVVAQDAELVDLAANLRTSLWNEVTKRLASPELAGVPDWPPPGAYGTLRWNLLQRAEQLAIQLFPDANPDVTATLSRYLFSKIDSEAQGRTADLLGAEISESRREAALGPRGEMELVRLESDVAQKRRLVQSAEEQVLGTDVRGAVEAAKMGLKTEILDPATLPLKPVWPNRQKLLVASIFVGIMLGLGLTYLIETLDPVLRRVEDFAKVIPEPVLGTTPLLSRRAVIKHGWLRRHWATAASLAVALLTGAFFLVRGPVFHAPTETRVPAQTAPESVPDANR